MNERAFGVPCFSAAPVFAFHQQNYDADGVFGGSAVARYATEDVL